MEKQLQDYKGKMIITFFLTKNAHEKFAWSCIFFIQISTGSSTEFACTIWTMPITFRKHLHQEVMITDNKGFRRASSTCI